MEIGDRIGAVTHEDDAHIYLVGFGEYAGHEVPNGDAAGVIAEAVRIAGATNPKLVLDDGTVVWGCEVWWGSEDGLKRKIEESGKSVVEVDIEEERRKAKK